MEHLKEKIKPYFREGGHGLDHIERVYNLAIRIAEQEKADMDIVKASALLHDIARKKQSETGLCHAEQGSKMAPEILEKIKFPKEKIPAVVHCIEVHRVSKKLKAETKEAQIIQDADRLDAIGAVAISRVLIHNTTHNTSIYNPHIKPKEEYDGSTTTAINHFYEKILKLKPESFHTELAQEIAKERY
ncbi:HD domain-containing protein, partial [Candidatus Woesearchaeota archaeon]|nr:HD domain-containing protein [Candidatus Woesearchaeota archaeon]